MEGLRYDPHFLDEREQSRLIDGIAALPFHDVVIRGGVARRKVIHYGFDYDYEGWSIRPTDPPPLILEPLIARCASAAGLEPSAIEQTMVALYEPGATIGWHRDAPMFGEPVIGVSLGSACIMRFRRKVGERWERESLRLEPGSLYLLAGPARRLWQHSIPPVPARRYSITLRVVRHSKRSARD